MILVDDLNVHCLRMSRYAGLHIRLTLPSRWRHHYWLLERLLLLLWLAHLRQIKQILNKIRNIQWLLRLLLWELWWECIVVIYHLLLLQLRLGLIRRNILNYLSWWYLLLVLIVYNNTRSKSVHEIIVVIVIVVCCSQTPTATTTNMTLLHLLHITFGSKLMRVHLILQAFIRGYTWTECIIVLLGVVVVQVYWLEGIDQLLLLNLLILENGL